MPNYSDFNLCFFFWNTIIHVIKAKYKINKICIIKAGYVTGYC